MGVWGPGIFSDDVACEVRSRYRELVAEGYESAAATDALLATFGEVLADEDSAAVMWLALAVTQWRIGRLEDRVRVAALRVIEDGTALWPFAKDAALARKRQKELSKTAELLRSPQPAAKRVRKPYRNTCDWETGELIAFQLRSGKNVLFRVVGLWTDGGGTSPVVEVLDWCDEGVPEREVLERLPIRHVAGDGAMPGFLASARVDSQFMLCEVSERRIPRDRISRLQIKTPPAQGVGGFTVCLWREVDEKIEREFGWR